MTFFTSCGYPDAGYLGQLEEQLKALGIDGSKLKPRPDRKEVQSDKQVDHVASESGASDQASDKIISSSQIHIQPPSGKFSVTMEKKRDLPGFENQGRKVLAIVFQGGKQEVSRVIYTQGLIGHQFDDIGGRLHS